MKATVHIYHHRFTHWLYSISTTFILLGLIYLNNHYIKAGWIFDLFIFVFWFVSAALLSAFIMRKDMFIGTIEQTRAYLDGLEALEIEANE